MELEDIKKVGVVGSGIMGHGIAFAFSIGGFSTLMCDINDEILKDAMAKIESTGNIFVEEGLLTHKEVDDAMARIRGTTDLEELAADTDFITEGIIERHEDKKKLFNTLDEICRPHTIIVSNTSSLVLSEFASEVKRQDKIAITHYFNPPAIVPGVEVAKGPATSDETFDITCRLMKRIRHVPIRVLKEMPGYLLNRIQFAMTAAAYRLWAEGVATAEDIDLGIRSTFGFRMPNVGPFMHFDLCGLWNQPKETRAEPFIELLTRQIELSPEEVEKIRYQYTEGEPWFYTPETYDETIEQNNREYARRFKQLYWSKKE